MPRSLQESGLVFAFREARRLPDEWWPRPSVL